ncbi:MAG: ROK family protein [Chthoniobacteraceae bacterium]
MSSRCEAIGIDLGGTQIKAVVVGGDGEVRRRELRETKDDDSAGFAASIRELSDDLGPALPVGLAAPGLVAADGRSIAHLPGRLGGLEGLDWTDFLGRPVPVTNDAHASLIGECWLGAARGLSDAILLTLGTGVGGAILADGRLLRGCIGRAGHLGHATVDYRSGMISIVGMPGALECMLGNYNIRERTGGRFDTTHSLIVAAERGEPEACEIWMESMRTLAAAIASFVNILDPEAVIIGGGIAQAGDALFRPLAAELARLEWRPAGHCVRLIPAALGEWAGAIGAARQALDT